MFLGGAPLASKSVGFAMSKLWFVTLGSPCPHKRWGEEMCINVEWRCRARWDMQWGGVFGRGGVRGWGWEGCGGVAAAFVCGRPPLGVAFPMRDGAIAPPPALFKHRAVPGIRTNGI